MIIREDFSGSEERFSTFLTIGFFDGVHLGHQKVIEGIVERARGENLQSCVITFNHHPSELFSGNTLMFLTSWQEKKEILQKLGVDSVQVFTFNSQFASLSPTNFLQKLTGIFDIREILVGEDFVFGFKRKGNINFLRQHEAQFGYRVQAITPVRLDGERISSSLLREWLKRGQIKKVTQGLGHPPTIIGTVIAGRKKGREIGCPTANLQPHPQKLLPCSGVYVGYVRLGAKMYKAVINVGGRPTFGDFTPGVEVHVMDFSGELYGKGLRIDLVQKIRNTCTFVSASHLSQQLQKDKERAEKILNHYYF